MSDQTPSAGRIVRYVDRDGRTLEDHTALADPWAPLADRLAGGYAQALKPPEQVIDGTTAFLTTHLMQEVVQALTGALDRAHAGH